MGFLGLSIQGYFTITKKIDEGYSLFYAINHFYSYFTIIINTLVSFFMATVWLKPSSDLSNFFKRSKVSGAIALYILIVGAIYYALLFNPNKPFSPEIFATHILHAFIPVAYLSIWFLCLREAKLRFVDAFNWLWVPLCYFIYILIRGEVIKKYPYFFVDVEKYGYTQVLINAFTVLAVFLILGFLLIFLDKKIDRKEITK